MRKRFSLLLLPFIVFAGVNLGDGVELINPSDCEDGLKVQWDQMSSRSRIQLMAVIEKTSFYYLMFLHPDYTQDSRVSKEYITSIFDKEIDSFYRLTQAIDLGLVSESIGASVGAKAMGNGAVCYTFMLNHYIKRGGRFANK